MSTDRVREASGIAKRARLTITTNIDDIRIIRVSGDRKMYGALAAGDFFRSTRSRAFATTGVQTNISAVFVGFRAVHLSPVHTAIRRSKQALHLTRVNDCGVHLVAATNGNFQIAGVVDNQVIYCGRTDLRPGRAGIF